MASTLGKVSLFVYIQKSLIVLSVLRENKYFLKTCSLNLVRNLLKSSKYFRKKKNVCFEL
jgi:hypothetical protein